MYKIAIAPVVLTLILGCQQGNKQDLTPAPRAVQIETNFGSIVIELYDETPGHRDNFVKLVDDTFYDSLLFHRVIEDFVLQTGDPESKYARQGDTLGNGGHPYTVPAEFHPEIFHKRGAVGAARDSNPARASSSTQFYIVKGRTYNDSTLAYQQGRINTFLARNRVVNDPANQNLVSGLDSAATTDNAELTQALRSILDSLTEKEREIGPLYVIPDHQRRHYLEFGGAAHLDQNYTVFGEVVKGMDVVDKIAAVSTDSLDRPIEEVRIIWMRLSREN